MKRDMKALERERESRTIRECIREDSMTERDRGKQEVRGREIFPLSSEKIENDGRNLGSNSDIHS